MFKNWLNHKLAYFLLGFGLLLLAINTNLFRLLPSMFSILFFSAVAFLFYFKTAKSLKLWMRIVGVAFIFIITVSSTGPLAEMVPLLFIAFAFFATYFNCQRCWWALIPAGVFSSLAVVVLLENLFPSWDFGSVFLLGLGATFSALYLLPGHRGGKRWAIYPAISLIILTVISNDPRDGDALALILPMIFITSGGFLLWWWNKNRK